MLWGVSLFWGGATSPSPCHRHVPGFFISGFPGGVDYVMLVLLKNGMTDKLTCKRYIAMPVHARI